MSASDLPPQGRSYHYAGGPKIPVTDGGTGASNHQEARKNLRAAPFDAAYVLASANPELPAAVSLGDYSNIAYLDAANVFTQPQTYNAAITINASETAGAATFSGNVTFNSNVNATAQVQVISRMFVLIDQDQITTLITAPGDYPSAITDRMLSNQAGILPTHGVNTTSVADAAAGMMSAFHWAGKTAEITAKKLCNATAAGNYRVSGVLSDTTASAAGTATLTIAWTDRVGATTSTVAQVLTGTGRTPFSVDFYLASGHITVAVALSAVVGNPVYALDVTPMYLG